jgi:hypothetical protein
VSAQRRIRNQPSENGNGKVVEAAHSRPILRTPSPNARHLAPFVTLIGIWPLWTEFCD